MGTCLGDVMGILRDNVKMKTAKGGQFDHEPKESHCCL